MIVQEWFDQLAPRERLMVAGCSIVIGLALIWTFAIQPIFVGGAALQVRVAEKQARLANLHELASQITPGTSSRPSNVQGSRDSIVVIIDRTTRERNLASYLKRNQPEGDSGVRLRFEDAPFDELMAWIGELQNYGMTTATANLDQAGTGRVNCSLLLSRSGT